MTMFISKNTPPDSLAGTLFALEGFQNSMTLLNGPTGCKFYHSAVSDGQMLRSLSFDTLCFEAPHFFGQPRIPSTYLDGHDFIYGVKEKMVALLDSLGENTPEILSIVNSPGAALIGDDLMGIVEEASYKGKVIVFEQTGYSRPYAYGWLQAFFKILDVLKPKKLPVEKGRVNILGLHLYQRHAQDQQKFLKQTLEDCGLFIGTTTLDTSLSQWESVSKAQCNLVFCPELSLPLAQKLKKMYNTPYLVLEEGDPVGFYATQRWLEKIRCFFGADISKPQEELERARARAYIHLARYSSLLGYPKGALFSVRGSISMVSPLSLWLSEYLGMIPVAIDIVETSEEMQKWFENELTKIGFEKALTTPIEKTPTHMIFADGNTVSQAIESGWADWGMEIEMPTVGYEDILPKGFYGAPGALYILEMVLNGLRFSG